jgi:hypothetical protein
MSSTKESLVQRDVLSLVATCLRIASANPRTSVQGTVSPLTKSVRTFSRALESMEPEEVMSMAKSFYSKQYLTAVGDDTWLDSDVDLVYGGDDVDAIRLRITHYARVAKELKGDEYDTLRYHCLHLVQRLATKAVAETLDEKILPLEKKLGKATTSSIAASLGGQAGGAGGIINTLMSAVGPMMSQLTGEGESSLKSLLANPSAASMMRSLTSNLAPEYQQGLEPMLDDIQKGTFDFSKVLERALQGVGSAVASSSAGPVELVQTSLPARITAGDESAIISTTDVVIPTLPEGACADGVCYPEDHTD